MLRDYRCVVRRAAGYEMYLRPARGLLGRPRKFTAQVYGVVRDAPKQCVCYDVRLFVDLLQHEVRVFAAVRHGRVPV